MRLYNVNPVKEQFPWGEMTVVKLGEKGRARKQTLIPFHARSFDKDREYSILPKLQAFVCQPQTGS